MRQNPKDKLKVVVLVGALVCLWLFIGLRFFALSGAHKAKEEARERRQEAARVAQNPQVNPAATSPTLRLAALVTPVEPPKDDPFRPIIPPRRHAQATPAPTTNNTQPQDRPALLPPMPNSSSSAGRRSQLYLAGIIVGTPSTAVLRWGEDHYVVREGDYLDNDLRVQQIKKDSVTLRGGGSTYVLRLGR